MENETTLTSRIVEYMRSNLGKHSARDVAEAVGCHRNSPHVILRRLALEGVVDDVGEEVDPSNPSKVTRYFQWRTPFALQEVWPHIINIPSGNARSVRGRAMVG